MAGVTRIPAYLQDQIWLLVRKGFTLRKGPLGAMGYDDLNIDLMRNVALDLQVALPASVDDLGASATWSERGIRDKFNERMNQAMALFQKKDLLKVLQSMRRYGVSFDGTIVDRVLQGHRPMFAPASPAGLELDKAVQLLRTSPSDAYGAAVKAVEHAALPVVLPNNPKATLGRVINEIEKGSWGYSVS